MDDFDNSDLSALFAEVDELEARCRAPGAHFQVGADSRTKPRAFVARKTAITAASTTMFAPVLWSQILLIGVCAAG